MSQRPNTQEAKTGSNANWVLVVAMLGLSLAFLDGTVVNVALPAPQAAFRATGADVQAYALLLEAWLIRPLPKSQQRRLINLGHSGARGKHCD